MVVRQCGGWRRVSGFARDLTVVGFALGLGVLAVVGARAEDGPTGPLALDSAVAAALAHNPDLAVHGYEVRAREARAVQEGLLPNPSLATEVENFGRFGGDQRDVEETQTTVSLTQVVELGGKRRERAAVARLDGRLAGWDYERARAEVAAATTRAFGAALVARERMRLAERGASLARETRTSVAKQVAAGVASPVETARAESALAQADAESAHRERERQAAYLALAATWGSPEVGFTELVGSVAPLAPPRPLAALTAELDANPDLARFATGHERAAAAVALAEAHRLPDVTVRVGARRFVSAETNAFVAEVSVPLPLFDRNQGAVLEAHEQAGKVQAEEKAARMAVHLAVRKAYEELRAACEEARTVRRAVLPRAERALAETRRGYDQGLLRHLDVIEAQQSIARVESDYLDLAARHQAAAAEILRLTGRTATLSASERSTACDGQ